jgi:hypothetical protein
MPRRLHAHRNQYQTARRLLLGYVLGPAPNTRTAYKGLQLRISMIFTVRSTPIPSPTHPLLRAIFPSLSWGFRSSATLSAKSATSRDISRAGAGSSCPGTVRLDLGLSPSPKRCNLSLERRHMSRRGGLVKQVRGRPLTRPHIVGPKTMGRHCGRVHGRGTK